MRLVPHLSFDELILAPSEEWFPRCSGWHLARLERGAAYWLGEEGLLDLAPADVVVLPPACHGVLRASKLGTAALHWFRFCPDLLTSVLSFSERRFLEALTIKPRVVPIKLRGDHPAPAEFTALIAARPESRGLEQRARLLRVVALAFEWSDRVAEEAEGVYLSSSARMELLMAEMTEAELCGVSAGDMAERCGCRVDHFKRLFQGLYGVSFSARQMELRLLMARDQLAATLEPIKNVARQAGFKRLSQFQDHFKKEFGLSPEAYRRMRHENREAAV